MQQTANRGFSMKKIQRGGCHIKSASICCQIGFKPGSILGICPEVSVQVIFLEGEEEEEEDEEVTKKDQENEVNEAIVYQLGALSDNSLFW